jgi:hypothetical protein
LQQVVVERLARSEPVGLKQAQTLGLDLDPVYAPSVAGLVADYSLVHVK